LSGVIAMETYAKQVAGYLFAQSWQIALLAVVVGLISFALRNKSAHIRYLLWLIVLAKCLVPPIYSVPVAVLPQESVVAPLPLPVSPEIPAGRAAPTGTREPVRIAQVPRTPEPKAVALGAREVVVVVWLVGALLFLVWVGSRAVRYTVWLCRRRTSLPPALHQAFEELFTGFKFKKPPRIWLTKDINQPFVWGLLRGSVYLPVDFVDLDGTQNHRTILAHELSHIARFDALINVVQVAAQAIYWFHPFVWWTNLKIRREREKCCDERAVVQLNTLPEHYTHAIVEALAAERRSARPIPSLAIVGSVKDIEERIRTMMRPGKKFYKRPSLIAVLIVLLLALLTVPTALVLTAGAQEKSTANPSPAPTAKDKAAATAALFRALLDNRTVRPDTVKRMRLAIAQGADLEAKNSRGYTPLHAAVRAYGNNYGAIRLLLEAGANPNARDPKGQIPLHHLVRGWGLSRVKLLVSAGSDVNARDKKGMTPATIAFEYGSSDMFDLMVAHGATMSADLMSAYKGNLSRIQSLIESGKAQETFEQDLTLLHAAVAAGHTEIAELLLRHGLDVRSQTQGGYTALHYAAAGNHRKAAELLLAKGADVNGPPGKQTPLHWAIREYHKDMIGWLLVKGANPNADGGRATPLQWAVWYEQGDIAALLVSHGGDIHLKTQHYPWTPLHEAVSGGNRAMVDALIAGTGDTIAAQWAPLHAAVASGDLQAVEDLLAKGADVNARGEGGNAQGEGGVSALHVAAGKGHRDIAELLITRGADVNEKGTFDDWKHGGWTPLYFAIWQGHSDVAELLLARGADVNVKDERNLMPLHLALYGWPTDLTKLLIVIERLIARDVDVNAKGTWGQTPLHIAVKKGYTDIIRMLLDKGANPNAKENERGKTPLHDAAKSGHKAVAELLISKGGDVNAKTEDGKTPMSLAKEKGYTEFIAILREHGAKDESSAGGDTTEATQSLHEVAANGDLEQVKFLIRNGADVNAKYGNGATPLHIAIMNGKIETAHLLIEKGADVNAMARNANTPLHVAALKGDMKTANLLISKGADVNAKTKYGLTPISRALLSDGGGRLMVELLVSKGAKISALHLAAHRGDIDKVRSSLAKGTKVDVRDTAGHTPLFYAASTGQMHVVEFLISKGADVNAKDNRGGETPLFYAGDVGWKNVVELLIAKGADVNARGMRRSSALTSAAWVGHTDVAELLIAKGADVNARDDLGYIPLHPAARNGLVEIVEMLISKGSDVNAKTGWGETPLHSATLGKELPGVMPLYSATRDGKIRVVQILIANGADVNVIDKKFGHTPLQSAQKNGYTEIVELLRKQGASE